MVGIGEGSTGDDGVASALLHLYNGDVTVLDGVRADLQASYEAANDGKRLSSTATDRIIHTVLIAEVPEDMGEPKTIDQVQQMMGEVIDEIRGK